MNVSFAIIDAINGESVLYARSYKRTSHRGGIETPEPCVFMTAQDALSCPTKPARRRIADVKSGSLANALKFAKDCGYEYISLMDGKGNEIERFPV